MPFSGSGAGRRAGRGHDSALSVDSTPGQRFRWLGAANVIYSSDLRPRRDSDQHGNFRCKQLARSPTAWRVAVGAKTVMFMLVTGVRRAALHLELIFGLSPLSVCLSDLSFLHIGCVGPTPRASCYALSSPPPPSLAGPREAGN